MNDNKTSQSLFWSAAMGAAAGAAAVILSDKKKRDKIKQSLNSMMEEVEEKKAMGKDKLSTELKKAKTKLDKIIDP